MKILIISAYFHPFTHPRAHRWTEIAANWAAHGHEIHVVTAKNPTEKSPSEVRGVTAHRAGFASLKEAFNFYFPGKIKRGELGGQKGGAGQMTRFLGLINDWLWRPFYWPDDAALWFIPARKLAKHLFSNHKFDAVVTVSMPFTGHLLGLLLKKKYPKIYWLADIGDPICFQRFPMQNHFFYKKLTQKFEKKVLLEADLVSVTNLGLVEIYQKNYGAPAEKMHVLPPISTGKKMAATVENQRGHFSKREIGTIDIGFFGTFFRGVREPDILLDLIKSMPIEWRGRVKFHVFGPVFHEFDKKLAGLPGLELHGFIPREAVFPTMDEMDFLLNVGNTDTFQLPSKLADYQISGLPIVNLCQIENDSFAVASSGHPLVLNLVRDEVGFSEKKVELFTRFLEKNRGVRAPESFVEKQIEAFSARRVAENYLLLIKAKKRVQK